MGQNQSTEKPQSGSRSGTPQAEKDRKVHRRISVQALSQGRAQPADASASPAVAQGTTSHSSERTNLHQMLQSTSPELTNKTSHVERSSSRASKPKKEAEGRLTPQPTVPVPTAVPSTNINIPAAPTPVTRTRQEDLEGDRRAHPEHQYAPVSHHRPPRLPLPIAEIVTPDSPTLLPVDKGTADVPIFEDDDQIVSPQPGLRNRRSSMLSVTTQDEEEVAEELQPYGKEFTQQTVPTTIEWNRPADKVFVTGTFAAWDKKFRLKKR